MAFEPLLSPGSGLRDIDFESLVRQHQGFIRAWLRRLTEGDTALADDLAQDTFLRALRGLQGFRGEAQPRTWLARIALHAWHDHLRAKQRSPVLASGLWPSEDDPAEDAWDHRAADGVAPGPSLADLVANRVDLERALQQLSEGERTVIIHACWGDLSMSDIAELTGTPLGTVKSLYRRGLQRLQSMMSTTSTTQGST